MTDSVPQLSRDESTKRITKNALHCKPNCEYRLLDDTTGCLK